jgi:hypothetical protein
VIDLLAGEDDEGASNQGKCRKQVRSSGACFESSRWGRANKSVGGERERFPVVRQRAVCFRSGSGGPAVIFLGLRVASLSK